MAMAGVLAIRLRPIFIMEEMKCCRSTGKAHWGIGMPQSLPQTFPATRRRFMVAHFLSVAKDVPIQSMASSVGRAKVRDTDQKPCGKPDLFDLAPGAHTPQEYGKYMIQQSGRFEYGENLDAFYDYEKYGTERMNAEDGMFTDRGYIAYKGYISMEEVMNGGQSSRMVLGGLSR